ncbi:MAG: hypothetical protein D3908_07500 [Candidatus Electrothrix sp. AUS4]|nr:hypothetical protein [Candidatus Electrothrix sp. AUS4]
MGLSLLIRETGKEAHILGRLYLVFLVVQGILSLSGNYISCFLAECIISHKARDCSRAISAEVFPHSQEEHLGKK